MAYRSPEDILKKARLCVLLTQEFCSMDIFKAAEILIRAGVDIIQLREKNLTDKMLVAAGDKLRAMTYNTPTLFFVNDRIDVALACAADGAHLGQDDMPVERFAAITGTAARNSLLLGVSTHDIDQAKAADGFREISYVAFGPIFPTTTKGYTEGVGLEMLRSAAGSTGKPVIAIGGITAENAGKVIGAGAQAVAVCSAIIGAADIDGAARRMIEAIG